MGSRTSCSNSEFRTSSQLIEVNISSEESLIESSSEIMCFPSQEMVQEYIWRTHQFFKSLCHMNQTVLTNNIGITKINILWNGNGDSIILSGSFNNWDRNLTKLQRIQDSICFSITVVSAINRIFQLAKMFSNS